MVSATWGVPVTVTGIWNPTSTAIRSPAPYVSPLAGLLAIETALTAGTVAAPFTLWFGSFVIATAARLSAASTPVAVLWIVPPFSVSALAPILIPSLSASVACTR